MVRIGRSIIKPIITLEGGWVYSPPIVRDDEYFLTEKLFAETTTDDDGTFHQIVQVGIMLSYEPRMVLPSESYPSADESYSFQPAPFAQQIEEKRRRLESLGFHSEWIRRYSDKRFLPLDEQAELEKIMNSVWDDFHANSKAKSPPIFPTIGTRQYNNLLDTANYKMPIIGWLHSQELLQIGKQLSRLGRHGSNQFIRSQIAFNEISRDFLIAWFGRNGLNIPDISKLTATARSMYKRFKHHKTTIFPDLINKLLAGIDVDMADIFPKDVRQGSEEAQHLTKSFRSMAGKAAKRNHQAYAEILVADDSTRDTRMVIRFVYK